MTTEFNQWWDSDKLTQTNQYEEDTPIYWAWEGYSSRDAEIVTLETRLEEKTAECQSFYEEAERVIKQRDQLREQVTMLRDALRSLWNERTPDSYDAAGEALAATEQK